MNGDLVTVIYFWKIKQRKVGFALLRMALDRGGLRKLHGVRFAKMLGAGKGETFTPRDADITRWGALIVIEQSQLAALDNSKLIKRWRTNSSDEVRYLVDPISSHGLWAKVNPFDYVKSAGDGEVVAITRARIKWAQNVRFWKAVPPVTSSLHSSPEQHLGSKHSLRLLQSFPFYRNMDGSRQQTLVSANHQLPCPCLRRVLYVYQGRR